MKWISKLVTIILVIQTPYALAQLPVVSYGKIFRIADFPSQFVDSRNIDVWVPEDYSQEKSYDVLYMQDGQMLYDSTITWNSQEWQMDETVQKLINENRINPCIVVGIWNNGKYRHSEYFPQIFLEGMQDDFKQNFIQTWLHEKPQSDQYLKFIAEELMPYIESNFSVKKGKEHTFIGGSSMGGLISMYAITRYRDKFSGVIGISTAWIGQRRPNTHIPIAAFNYLQENMPSPLDIRIYQDHGTDEVDSLYGNYQRIIDELFRDFGFQDYNYKSLVFEGTGHNENDWANRLEIPLEFMLKKTKRQDVQSGRIDFLENFPSTYIPARNIEIWLPPNYSPSNAYPVIYAHDGQQLFDPLSTWNNQSWDMDDVITTLSAEGAMPEVIVVGIWNGVYHRLEEYFPQKVFERLTTQDKAFITMKLQENNRSNHSFQPYSDNYLKFIVEELKPYVDSAYATKSDLENTIVLGSSAGGLISSYAITQYPEVFGTAICLSSHWTGIFQSENNPFPDQLIQYFDETLPALSSKHKIYMDVADQGLDLLYIPIQRRIDALMEKHHFDDDHWKTVFEINAEHTESSWNKRLPKALKFAFK